MISVLSCSVILFTAVILSGVEGPLCPSVRPNHPREFSRTVSVFCVALARDRL